MGKKSDGGCFLFFIGFVAISLVAKAVGIVLNVAFIAVLAVVGILIIQTIYHFFNPEAKKKYIDRKEKEAEGRKRNEKSEETEKIAAIKIAEYEIRRKELERQQHRDADRQESSYAYQIGQHGNESLAIRYGIANQERKVKEYWYYSKGGERTRNPDRDKVHFEPATTIRLQKTQQLGKDLYEVLLTDYRNRKAKAIIVVGTEYVKTFYPFEENWFEKHADLEKTLKGNGTFSLKELATFHVQKTVGA